MKGTAAVVAGVVAVGVVWFFLMRGKSDADLLREPLVCSAVMGSGSNLFRASASTEFARAVRDPKRWRQLDRIYRFDGVILDGNPSLSRPLVEHFRQSEDWVLCGVDHAALAFRRTPQTAWAPPDLGAWRREIDKWPTRVRAAAYAQAAGRLLVVGERHAARELADEAVRLAPGLADGWAQRAAADACRGKWEPALEDAERAIRLKRDLGAALSIKAQALARLGKSEAAYAASSAWVRAEPDDAQALFLHARMAHAVNAYGTEIESLKKLISLSEKDQAPVAGYRIFLGQALAKSGLGEEAAAEFEKAISSGELSPQEREFADEALGRLKPQANGN